LQRNFPLPPAEISVADTGEHFSVPVAEICGQQRKFPVSNKNFRSAMEFSAMGNVF